jgi:glycerol-3-phosphate dehydrogenase (NAD(P)+)
MSIVTILGAGAMGSAFCTPAVRAGSTVRLWGTWLDDEIVSRLRSGDVHPRTGVAVPDETELYGTEQLSAALRDADVVVIAVSSEGVVPVLEVLVEELVGPVDVACATKGFVRRPGTEVVELGIEAIDRALAGFDIGGSAAIGGPCKANEIAAGRESVAVFAGADEASLQRIVSAFSCRDYAIATTTDVIGVEVSAALKNGFAIAMGYAEGVGEKGAVPFHDLRAVVFSEAAREMAQYCRLLGGLADTAFGLAGVGDLEVTGFSGRNRMFGLRIGRGDTPADVTRQLAEEGVTVEGLPAVRLAGELAGTLCGERWRDSFPLLSVLLEMVSGEPVGVRELFRAAQGPFHAAPGPG